MQLLEENTRKVPVCTVPPPKCRQHSAAAACLPRTVHSTAVLQIVDRVLTVSLPPVRPSLTLSGLRTRASHRSKSAKNQVKNSWRYQDPSILVLIDRVINLKTRYCK